MSKIDMQVSALLIGSTKVEGMGYFDHVRHAISEFLGTPKPEDYVMFVPFARKEIHEWDMYTKNVSRFFEDLGFGCKGIHQGAHGLQPKSQQMALSDLRLKAIFVGGGVDGMDYLLQRVDEYNVGETIVDAVRNRGVKFIGSGVGADLASAINIVDFQVKSHFDPNTSTLDLNGQSASVGLPDTTWLRVQGPAAKLYGEDSAVIHYPEKELAEWPSGEVRTFVQ